MGRRIDYERRREGHNTNIARRQNTCNLAMFLAPVFIGEGKINSNKSVPLITSFEPNNALIWIVI